MKRVCLFATIGLMLTATTTFAADHDVGKEKVTFTEVQNQHEFYTVRGWDAVQLEMRQSPEGNFLLIKYKQNARAFVYSTRIVEGLTEYSFGDFKKLFKPPNKESKKDQKETPTLKYASSGGQPYNCVARVAHV